MTTLGLRRFPLAMQPASMHLTNLIFPQRNPSLTSNSCKHWLALMKISAEPSIYNGWKTHHNRNCDDPDLLKWAHAWRSHDKQLHSSFMDCPFIIDPDSSTYWHQFE